MAFDPKKLFLFNSGLPEATNGTQALLDALGPSRGNFRGRNIGNGYISHASLCGLFGKPLKLDHEANGWMADLGEAFVQRINSDYSHFVFVMQDFIRESFASQPFGQMADFLEKLKIPVVPLSLGANALSGYDTGLVDRLSPDQIRFLKVLSEKSTLIGVRGHYTADILHRLGIRNVAVTGCPSFFEHGARMRGVKAKKFDEDAVLTTGAYFHTQSITGPHILQDEIYFINALYFSRQAQPEEMSRNYEARPFDPEALHISYALYERAFSGRLRFFTDFNAWRKFYESRPFSLTVGSRLHAAIQSWNSGVRAIVTNGDARARETCEYHNIPNMPDLSESADLQSIFYDIDVGAMAKTYELTQANYMGYIKAHGIDIDSYDGQGDVFDYPDIAQKREAAEIRILSGGFRSTWNYTQTLLAQSVDNTNHVQALGQSLMASEQSVQVAQDALGAAAKDNAQLQSDMEVLTNRGETTNFFSAIALGQLVREAESLRGENARLQRQNDRLHRSLDSLNEAAVHDKALTHESLKTTHALLAEIQSLKTRLLSGVEAVTPALLTHEARLEAVGATLASQVQTAKAETDAGIMQVKAELLELTEARLAATTDAVLMLSKQLNYLGKYEESLQARATMTQAVNDILKAAHGKKLLKAPIHFESDADPQTTARDVVDALVKPLF